MQGLGITSSCGIELVELRLYKSGFSGEIQTQDTSFATVTIDLPCEFKGGQIVVKHKGIKNTRIQRQSTLDLQQTLNFNAETNKRKKREISSDDGFSLEFSTQLTTEENSDDDESNKFFVFFSVFFSQCKAEMQTITEGFRVQLIYNVYHIGQDAIPQVPEFTKFNKLETLVKQWETENTPKKLAVVLDKNNEYWSSIYPTILQKISNIHIVSGRLLCKYFSASFSYIKVGDEDYGRTVVIKIKSIGESYDLKLGVNVKDHLIIPQSWVQNIISVPKISATLVFFPKPNINRYITEWQLRANFGVFLSQVCVFLLHRNWYKQMKMKPKSLLTC